MLLNQFSVEKNMRSIDGITLLGECISRLQWVEFFGNDISKYSHELNILIALKKAISERETEESRRLLQEFKMSSAKIFDEFELFKATRSESSETFHYWNNF